MFRAPCFGLILGLISVSCFAQSAATQSASQQASTATEKAGPAPQTVPAPTPLATLPAPRNLLGEARALYRKGDFDGAIGKYQEFLKGRPGSPDAFAGIVRAQLKQKNVELAAQTAEQGLAQSNSARIHVARGEVWFRQGKIAEAEKEWVDVINSGYPEARAYLGLARVRDAIAMYKTAKRMIDKAHELDPDDPDIQQEWISTLSRSARIKYLKDSLAGENNWDLDERADAVSYLAYLEERAKRKNDSPCRLVGKVTSTETPLVPLLQDPQHLRGYGLAVSLNGHKSYLMLDTGAGGILVKRSIAEHAGISKITETKVMGIGKKGRRDAYVGVADSIKIGELEFQNCPIEVMESRSVAGEEGLIGADVFESFLVDIDFPNEKLKLSQLPKRPGEAEQEVALKNEDDDPEDADSAEPADSKPAETKTADRKAAPTASSGPEDRYIAPEMQSYTRVFRFGHDLLVPTTIGQASSKLFLMDTGALLNAISPAAAREVTKVHNEGDITITGISGSVDKVYTANKAVLQFGHLRQENQDITSFDTTPISDGIGTEVSGFLGFVMLRMLEIKIDYRDALVDFEYDAKRWNR